MSETRIIWLAIAGTSGLTVWRAIRTQTDPIPQLAGIGVTGVFLLMIAELQPKLASGFAMLFGIAYALNWDQLPALPDTVAEQIDPADRKFLE